MIFGVLSLLLVVAVVGMLAKKQLSAVSAPPASDAGVVAPVITTPQQGQQLQDQIKKSLEDAMQKPRVQGDEK